MFWFIASQLDPRFKKLSFKDDGMLSDHLRVRAIKWLTTEFDKNFKGKVVKAAEATAAATTARGAPSGRHVKRRKTSAASFFADSDDSSEDDGDVTVAPANPEDEMTAYLNLPQIKYVTEQDMMNWWKDHQKEFPNVAVMARQYLGCPA